MKLEFPTKESSWNDKVMMPLKTVNMNTRSTSSDARVQPWRKPRSRTPTMRNRQQYQHLPKPPSTPTSVYRPRLQRSNSQTGGGVNGSSTAHRSAKKWARTAHLHEVHSIERRKARTERTKEGDNENAEGAFGLDPFWVSDRGRKVSERRRKGGQVEKEAERGLGVARVRPATFKPSEEWEGDPWVDTDLDGEDGDGDWKIDTATSAVFSAVGNGH